MKAHNVIGGEKKIDRSKKAKTKQIIEISNSGVIEEIEITSLLWTQINKQYKVHNESMQLESSTTASIEIRSNFVSESMPALSEKCEYCPFSKSGAEIPKPKTRSFQQVKLKSKARSQTKTIRKQKQ